MSSITRCVVIGLAFVLAGRALAQVPQPASDAQRPWSFEPLRIPTVPRVQDANWPTSEIDRFVLARLEHDGLHPSQDAPRERLIRRAAFDLTGLPPAIEDIDAFCADERSDDLAFAKIVDRYLQSPRFGERWGRHWLDVVRYADSVGHSWNAPFTYAWRYRDYVIDSFDQDKPFDRFILEQLAGDLLPAESIDAERDQRIATGFLALGSINLQERSREQSVLDRVDEQIDVTSRAFLGLTVSCARCHDHKTDPITMRDYYAWAGIFYSTRTWTGQGTLTREFGSQDYVDGYLLMRLPDRVSGRTPANPIPGIHSMSDFQDEWRQGLRKIRYTTDPNLAMGVSEGTPRDCAIRLKGQPFDLGDEPPRGDVRTPGLPPFPSVPTDRSGRLELARWIASRDHPLTGRMLVNRVWQHLFGRGLVATPDEFGMTSEPPIHRELLDYLAIRFVDEGWSVKKLIRSIMLSRVYRLDSIGQHEQDTDNMHYWRANLRRLEIEPLRDSLLLAAGRLTFERPHGIQVAGTGGKARGASTYSLLEIDAPYRTVYLPVLRSLLPEMFHTFDFPDPHQIQGHREVTTVAPQALFFMNSDFVAGCAHDAAVLLLKNRELSAQDRIDLSYRKLLGRRPTDEELSDASGLLHDLQRSASSRSSEVDCWTTLIQGLMASAEFRYVR